MAETFISRFFCLVSLVVICKLMGNDIALAAKPMDAATVKQKVDARGIGKDLKVTEAGGTTITGSIVWIGEESFRLKVKNEPQPTEISFAQVTDVRNQGLSKGAKIGIAAGIVVVVVVVVAVVIVHAVNSSIPKTIPIG
jgi:hypothetical protein